jgi:hypothetical protein
MKKTMFILLVLVAFASLAMAVPRELVIVEIGTGTWCPYCPGASMGAHDLLNNGYAVGVVKYHNGDSFTTATSNARNTYYGISSFPTTLFDGLNRYTGGSATQSLYNTFLPRVTSRLAVPSSYTISASGANNGNNYMIMVNVDKPEADANTNVVLHAAITQSNIVQSWQGQTHVHNAMRIMVPNQNGTPVSLGTGEGTVIPLSFAIQSTWPVQDLELVLWLQNTVTKEILQGKKYALNQLPAGASVSSDFIMFPSISINTSASKSIAVANFGNSVVNANITIDNPAFTSDVSSFTLQPASGRVVNFTFNPTAAQPYEGFVTITGNFPDGNEHSIVLSGNAFFNSAPSVSNLVASGVPVHFQTLSSSYVFSDPESHNEGATTFQWLRLANDVYTPINGAVSNSYQIVAADVGYQLAVEVTPRDEHGFVGNTVRSAPTAVVIALPAPQNFQASVELPSNVMLTWERPQYFETRNLLGYKIFRNDLNIANITNPNTLNFLDTYLDDGTYDYYIVSMFQNPYQLSGPTPIVTVHIGEVSNQDDIISPVSKVNVHPNPFSSVANFAAVLKSRQATYMQIYNVKGQLVRTLQLLPDAKGHAVSSWDGKTDAGATATNGVYFYVLKDGSSQLSGKLMLVK